jgi:hypothetical protein
MRGGRARAERKGVRAGIAHYSWNSVSIQSI